VLGTADAVALGSDGSFVAAFGDVVLPDAYSPTGTAVTLADLQLDGQFTAPDAVCGTVTALVVEVRLPLTESTFGGAPWDSGIVPAIDCDGEPMMPLARIDPRDCPALLDGLNASFPSAELDRELYLYFPSDVDAGGPWPVVFAYHGLGDTADWITVGGDNDLITPIDDRGYILVSPESQALPGTEWEQANTNDNADLVFFDDILTCIDAQYGVDPDQIYVTGMSAGGLYTSYLGLVRADVIAALAPMSGGLLVDYAAPAMTRPYLVSWGGVDDNAVGQDFDQFAQDLMSDLGANGHFYAACDHGQGHTWPAEMTDPVLEFLFAHPSGTDPSPYADGLPPADFPNFCTVP
jgi:predicted esterase